MARQRRSDFRSRRRQQPRVTSCLLNLLLLVGLAIVSFAVGAIVVARFMPIRSSAIPTSIKEQLDKIPPSLPGGHDKSSTAEPDTIVTPVLTGQAAEPPKDAGASAQAPPAQHPIGSPHPVVGATDHTDQDTRPRHQRATRTPDSDNGNASAEKPRRTRHSADDAPEAQHDAQRRARRAADDGDTTARERRRPSSDAERPHKPSQVDSPRLRRHSDSDVASTRRRSAETAAEPRHSPRRSSATDSIQRGETIDN